MDLVSWLPLIPDAVPDVLRRADAWLCWRAEVRDGKTTKVPTSPDTGRDTDATAARWTFEQAVAGAEAHGLDGVGFALDGEHGLDLVGVDIDHCRDPETGEIHPGALEILRALDSYAEVSPSATGARGFVLGKKPGRRCKRAGAFDGFEVEIYDAGRYLTVTGHRIDGAPPDVRPAQEALADLYARIVPPEAPPRERPANGASSPTDADVLQRARAARNGAKFERLYRGDASGYDGDESSADLAFVAMLAFWTQDPAQIDRIVRGSGLLRDKWDARRGAQTYGERTVDAALASVGETFDWSRSSGRPDGPPDADGLQPEPPADGRPTIPDRVFTLLPSKLADACGRFERWTERHAYLVSLLVCLTAALPHVRLRYGRRYLSPHLFAFLIGDAASGKGVVELARAWLDPVDDLLTKESTAARDAWTAKKAERDRLRRSRKKADQDEVSLLDETDPLGPEPPLRYVLMGEDTTSAGLVDAVHDNAEGVALVSTEADTVTDANGKEHGRFSSLMRKAFHNERHAENRRSGGRLVVKAARLAVLLAGTRGQVRGLFEKGVEDGLYSRFVFYRLGGAPRYESQREVSEDVEFDRMTAARAADALAIHSALAARAVDAEGQTAALYIDLPRASWDRMDAEFKALFDRLFVEGDVDPALAATVKRAPVVCYRIASVLAVWRAHEGGVDLRAVASLTVSDDDAEAALLLSLVFVETAIRQAGEFGRRYDADPGDGMGGTHRITSADRDLLDSLGDEFTPDELVDAGEALGMSRATVYRHRPEWIEAGLFTEHKDGRRTVYRKAAPPAQGDFRGDGLATEPPDLAEPALHKGARVRTPDGEGVVLQVFAEAVTVHLDGHDRASRFAPSRLVLLDTPPAEAPF